MCDGVDRDAAARLPRTMGVRATFFFWLGAMALFATFGYSRTTTNTNDAWLYFQFGTAIFMATAALTVLALCHATVAGALRRWKTMQLDLCGSGMASVGLVMLGW